MKCLKYWFLIFWVSCLSAHAEPTQCRQFTDSLYRALPGIRSSANLNSLYSRLEACLLEAGQEEGLKTGMSFLTQAKRNHREPMVAFKMYEAYAWLLREYKLEDSALYFLEDALVYIQDKGKNYEGEALQNISRKFYDWGYRQKGLEYALNSVPLLTSKKAYRELALAYETIGYVYFHEKFYTKSIEAFNQVLEANQQIDADELVKDDHYLKIHAYNTLGLAYYHVGDFDKAMMFFDDCEKAAVGIGDKFWLGLVNGNRAMIYIEQKDYQKAIPALMLDINAGKMQHDFDNAAISMQELAIIHLNLGNTNLGKMYLDSAISMASSKKYLKFPRYWLVKSKLESISGKWHESNVSLERSYFLLDSMMKRREKLNLINIEKSVQEQQRLIDVKNKEAMAQVLDSKISLQRIIIIAIALVLGLAVVMIVYIVSINKKLAVQSDRALAASRAKSEILANVSHEFRTPLNAISGFSELLISKLDNEKHRMFAHQIHEAGKNLTVLVNDILDLSKAEAGKIELHQEEFNLNAFLLEIEQFFTITARDKRLNFQISVNEDVGETIKTDYVRLRQILLNLLSNAFKFTERGIVSLSVFHSANNRLCFLVADTGPGIPREDQHQIFEAFVQKKNQSAKYGGTGLGLAISKKLIDVMNGTITLESEENKGTSFKICIPVNAPD